MPEQDNRPFHNVSNSPRVVICHIRLNNCQQASISKYECTLDISYCLLERGVLHVQN